MKVLKKALNLLITIIALPFLVIGAFLYALSFGIRALGMVLMIDYRGAKREVQKGLNLITRYL